MPLSVPFKVQFPFAFSPDITRLNGLLAVRPWYFPTQMSAKALAGTDPAILAEGDGSARTQRGLSLSLWV